MKKHAIVSALLLATSAALAQDATPPRQPQFPLKTQRLIYTDTEIATARANVAKYPTAKKVADDLIKTADTWAAMSDEKLRSLITTSQVTRAFDVGTAGCPKCGHEIYEKFGQYGWITDPNKPFKVTCPVCKSVYPSNDYGAYYESGFKDKKGWDTPYVDDGWGWKDPKTGEKYWFVAFYNHWMWHRHLVPGVNAMAKAYLLTGDKKYAHKAAVALERIAEVYPAMDYENQSRYGQMMKAKGGHYPGKVVNLIWECGLIANLAEAYDAVWETIDADTGLQKDVGKTGEQIRASVEANLLEEGIDSVLDGKIQGNFGMHQHAMVKLALARQYGDHDKWLGGLVDRNDGVPDKLGLRYALYDLVYRDGLPDETSPHYNGLWVGAISRYAPLLKRAGYDVMGMPRTHRLYDGILDQVCVRALTPDTGDTASVWGDPAGWSAWFYAAAYRAYQDPRYANALAAAGTAGEKGFTSFDTLLYPPIESTVSKRPAQASRVLDGYGMGILNDPSDSVAAAMYYGLRAGHGHYDRLNFELFAHGVPILPDLGYPDAMNDFVPGIFTWSKNTVAHNCVVVDAKRQLGNVPGTVELFADSPFARVLDVEAKETYPQCSSYRRALVMIDAGNGESYYVDFFTVAGGHQHDYSLHGPPGKFETTGIWTDPQPGTLAGKDVKLGDLYDQPNLSEKTGFSGYTGSGFQHLTNVRTLESGEPVAQWEHETHPDAHLRIRVLPQEGQKLILAEARVSPVKYPQTLRYLIARREGENLSSRFVSVIEPYGKAAFVDAAKELKLEKGAGSVVEVKRGAATDVVIYDPAGASKVVAGIETDAKSAVVTREGGTVKRVFFAGGSVLNVDGKSYTASAVAGTVIGTDPQKSIVRVKVSGAVDPAALVGRLVHFENDLHKTAHPVAAARLDGDHLVLMTKDDLLVGRIRVGKVVGETVTTKTAMPLAATYRGAVLAGEDLAEAGRVREITGSKIRLTDVSKTGDIEAGKDAWLVNVGSGDRLEVPSIFWWDSDRRVRID